MTQPFLYTVAEALYQQHAGNLHNLAVVFPNKRQAIYFEHYLKQVAAPPCFLPATFSIEALVGLSTKLHIADNLTQGFVLYEAYTEIAIEKGDDKNRLPGFDNFCPIGETLIKDFRELDAYCADVNEVCSLLFEIENIDKAFDQLTEEQREYLKQFWKGAKDKSKIQEKFLKLWERLPAIYTRFHELLAANGLTTMGAVYRNLAANISLDSSYQKQWNHIAFVGFNAFNKAESIFLKRWHSKGFSSFWYDADTWYTENNVQEAGDFIRKNLYETGLPNSLPNQTYIANKTTPVKVIAAAGNHLQTKTITPWLKHLPSTPQSNIGILLADEALLLPVLGALPDSLQKVNVTMGYPLQQSAVFDLVKLFLDIQTDIAKNKTATVDYKLVNRWLQHPLCTWPEKAKVALQKTMLDNQWLQVAASLLYKLDEASALMFGKLLHPNETFEKLIRLCELSLQNAVTASDDIVRGLLVTTHQKLQQLQQLVQSLPDLPSYEFLAKLLLRQLATVSAAFEGEPLVGVQVMGLLESRGIDFDHLILLGASEGNLPRIKQPDTFLPRNIRRAFGLTIPEHQDAIFAYVFYRLLHRSESMTIVYNSLITDSSTGELSRFVQQLQFESRIPFELRTFSLPVTTNPAPPISIAKNDDILTRLWLIQSGKVPLSPSGINTYISCRLQFYFQYVLKLKKPDQLQEKVEANMVGSAVHQLMENLYKPWIGKQIQPNDIATMQQQAAIEVEPAIKQVWLNNKEHKSFVLTGELLIIKEVVLQYAKIFLNADKAYAPFTVKELEIVMQQPFPLYGKKQTDMPQLKGYADRVDVKNGVTRMVDYKTGGDKAEFNGIELLFERDGKKNNKAALQTLLYSWLFYKQQKTKTAFEPSLQIARSLTGKNNFTGNLLDKSTGEVVNEANILQYLNELEERMNLLFAELFDEATPFDQTTELKRCGYCDYAAICNRS